MSDDSPGTDRSVDDPHRPRHHVSPPENWMNDPNGLLQWNGTYHLFYQHNPREPRWGNVHWGHAASDDLLSWEDRPLALAPESGIDGDGCFSGCAVVDEGTPTLVYTGVESGVQRQCLATSPDPGLNAWEKAGPVLSDRPRGVEASQFRDPHVWREGGRWKMLLGARIEDEGAAILRYRSPDLREWIYEGVELADPAREGVLECPGLVRFDARDLLFYSTMDERSVVALLGDAGGDDDRFAVDERERLDHGDLYAPQVMRDERGRALLWGWITEARSETAQVEAGWSGAMSLPRTLSIADGSLRQRPVRELAELRRNGARHVVAVDGERELDRTGRSLEIELTVPPTSASRVGLSVLRSPDGAERTDVVLDRDAGDVIVDRGRTGVGPDAATVQRGPLPETGTETTVRVFVDGSVVETFVDGRTCIASRAYPSRSDSRGVAVLSEGGRSEVAVSVWDLGSIWT